MLSSQAPSSTHQAPRCNGSAPSPEAQPPEDPLVGYEILRAWSDLDAEELEVRFADLRSRVEDPALPAATRKALALAMRSIYAFRKMRS